VFGTSLENNQLNSAGIVPITTVCPSGPFCIFDICYSLNHSVQYDLGRVKKSLLRPILLFLRFSWDTQTSFSEVSSLSGLLGYLFGLLRYYLREIS